MTDTPAPASPAATEMAAWPRVEMLHDGTILTQLGPTSRTELSTIAAATALRYRLAAYLDLHAPTSDLAALRAERDRLREAVDEWGAARAAVLASREQFTPRPLYVRLANAEAALYAMSAARAALAEGRADG